MARTTKASNAVLRLKQRSNAPYSMVNLSDGRFYLTLGHEKEEPSQVCEALEIDAFVQFVNNLHKLAPKRISKLDIAFEAKLKNTKEKT